MILRPRAYATRGGRRRGVILLVVLAVLTLFAIMGVTFVLYSGAEATSSRIFKEAGVQTNERNLLRTAAETAWYMYLGQQSYGVPDDATGVLSALRGHDLARNMYGWNPAGLNDKPFSGTGRLREPPITGTPIAGVMETENLVNYTYFQADGFVRDPARPGARATPADPQGLIAGDLHASYTFPDHNNMYLAVVNPADGQVLLPSYHRDWVAGVSLGNPAAPGWTSVDGKYRLMRPRQFDHTANFPLPTDAGGDVKNFDLAPGGNDSIWMDIGAPVMTAPDGKKFKALVAPLIIDLDGRINLNTAGNLLLNRNLAADQRSSASNQGWGPWEVNPAHVLDAPTLATAVEWKKIFLGDATQNLLGRYGSTQRPLGPGGITGGSPVRRYFPIDYNASTDDSYEYPPPAVPAVNSYVLTPPWQFPGTAATANTPDVPGYQAFPLFSQNAYNNAIPRETDYPAMTRSHPDAFNALRPAPGNKAFSAKDLVGLLRRANVGGDQVESELVRLLPNNLDGPTNVARRHRVTTHSFDVDRPGSPPYIWDRTGYNFSAAAGRPQGAAVGFPAIASRGATPADSEFSVANWASALAALGRIDLGRKLADYPPPDATFKIDKTSAQFIQAQADRQQLAGEIYTALWQLTGAVSPASLPAAATDPARRAHRWLAQLAVNIVDFIDYDDYMTTFQWTTGEYVVGTELPRLVINEYYAQWDNNVLDGTPAESSGNYRVNVWVELHNPLPAETVNPIGTLDPAQGQAILHNGTTPIYRMLLCRGPNPNIRTPENTVGSPEPNPAAPAPPHVVGTLTNWGTNRAVKPGLGLYSGAQGGVDGFYVVGPTTTYAGAMAPADPFGASLTPTHTSDQLTYTLTSGATPENPTIAPAAMQPDLRPSILLQRLANPYLDEQPNPTLGDYNPFVTVDYVDQLVVNDYRLYDDTGAGLMPDNLYTPANWRGGFGKNQPYASWHNPGVVIPATGAQNWHKQNATTLAMPTPTTTRNTFFRHNAVEPAAPPAATTAGQTLLVPFEPLAHFDRPMASVADLLHVSGFRPHELTQQFVTYTGGMTPTRLPNGHVAPWLSDPTTRVHRLWEYVTFKSRAAGVAHLGRVPGKININTVWDQSIFNALVDAQAAAGGPNRFTQTEVIALWTALVGSIRPDAGSLPGPNSKPFWGLGTGLATAADPLSQTPRGIGSTLLRPSTTRPEQLLMEPGVTAPTPLPHPLQRYELLSKIMGQLTTRSNVFAIWTTVGFFEVADPNASPVKLGAEVNWPTSGRVRFRTFAIVDRTQLQVWPTYDANDQPMVRSAAAIIVPPGQSAASLPISLIDAGGNPLTTVTHPYTQNGYVWQLQAGAVLTFDPDTDNEETVVVGGASPNFTATFRKSHLGNPIVISRGNPGPWLAYDPTKDVGVMLHQEILD